MGSYPKHGACRSGPVMCLIKIEGEGLALCPPALPQAVARRAATRPPYEGERPCRPSRRSRLL